VASFLLDEVEADVAAKGGRLLVAETSDTPAYGRARGFYLARGFSVAATVADFYQVGDGKVIFVKRLAVT
jgi:ribosomal protein S18 acetylase RimI-like enzyme